MAAELMRISDSARSHCGRGVSAAAFFPGNADEARPRLAPRSLFIPDVSDLRTGPDMEGFGAHDGVLAVGLPARYLRYRAGQHGRAPAAGAPGVGDRDGHRHRDEHVFRDYGIPRSSSASRLRGLRAVLTLRALEMFMVFAFWPVRPTDVMSTAGSREPAGPLDAPGRGPDQRNRTVRVSPVAGSRTSSSWPACRYASKNSYDVIARFAMSVLDRFVRS